MKRAFVIRVQLEYNVSRGYDIGVAAVLRSPS